MGKKKIMGKINYDKLQRLQVGKLNVAINKFIVKITSIFFILITAIYPIFLGGGYSGMTYRKTLYFWIVTGIAPTVLLFVLICVKGKFRLDNYYIENESRRKFTVAEWILLVFIVWTFISAALSVSFNPEWANSASVWFGANGRYEGFITFLCYAVTFFMTARFYKSKHLHLQMLAISAILVSFIGILQFFRLDIFKLYSSFFGSNNIEPLSTSLRTTLGNVNIVSSYCSFAVLLFSALFTVSRSKCQYLYLIAGAFSFTLSLTTGFSGDAHKVAILGSMILLIPYWLSDRERLGRILIVLSSWCAIYACHSVYISALKQKYEAGTQFSQFEQQFLNTYTDKNIVLFLIVAVILLAIGLVLLLLFKKWAEKPMKVVGIVLLPIILISSLAGLEIIGSRLSDQPDNIIWQAREMMHGRLDDDYGTYRGWIWRNAVEVIPDNPIFGTGPDTFFQAIGIERQLKAFEKYGLVYDRAHNIFLQIAVCMGIPALITYLIFLGSIFIPAMKWAFDRPILFAFGAAALSYVIQSFFSIEGPIVMPLLWIALGVMASEVWQAKIGCVSIEF